MNSRFDPPCRASGGEGGLRRFFLRGDFLGDDDSGKLHHFRRRGVSVLAEGRLVRQLLIGDLGERDIGVTEPGGEFHEWTMPKTELSHPARDHVHQNLLIRDNFGSGFNEIGFHIFIRDTVSR